MLTSLTLIASLGYHCALPSVTFLPPETPSREAVKHILAAQQNCRLTKTTKCISNVVFMKHPQDPTKAVIKYKCVNPQAQEG